MAVVTIGFSGGEKLRNHLDSLASKVARGKQVRVGFLEGAPAEPDGTPVAYVAAINEFGNPANNQPPRPYFRRMIAEKSPGWGAKMAKSMKATDMDAKGALTIMGENIASQLQDSIRDTVDPPLSPVTLLLHQRFPMRDNMTYADVLQAKRDVAADAVPTGAHANPLIWTGHMLNSVAYEVKD